MGTGFSKRKKQAKMLQQQLASMQDQIKSAEATGSAGNGLVTITLAGDNQMKEIKIQRDCVDPEDIEGLQDLIKAAYQDAHSKLQTQTPSLPTGFPDLSSLGF